MDNYYGAGYSGIPSQNEEEYTLEPPEREIQIKDEFPHVTPESLYQTSEAAQSSSQSALESANQDVDIVRTDYTILETLLAADRSSDSMMATLSAIDAVQPAIPTTDENQPAQTTNCPDCETAASFVKCHKSHGRPKKGQKVRWIWRYNCTVCKKLFGAIWEYIPEENKFIYISDGSHFKADAELAESDVPLDKEYSHVESGNSSEIKPAIPADDSTQVYADKPPHFNNVSTVETRRSCLRKRFQLRKSTILQEQRDRGAAAAAAMEKESKSSSDEKAESPEADRSTPEKKAEDSETTKEIAEKTTSKRGSKRASAKPAPKPKSKAAPRKKAPPKPRPLPKPRAPKKAKMEIYPVCTCQLPYRAHERRTADQIEAQIIKEKEKEKSQCVQIAANMMKELDLKPYTKEDLGFEGVDGSTPLTSVPVKVYLRLLTVNKLLKASAAKAQEKEKFMRDGIYKLGLQMAQFRVHFRTSWDCIYSLAKEMKREMRFFHHELIDDVKQSIEQYKKQKDYFHMKYNYRIMEREFQEERLVAQSERQDRLVAWYKDIEEYMADLDRDLELFEKFKENKKNDKYHICKQCEFYEFVKTRVEEKAARLEKENETLSTKLLETSRSLEHTCSRNAEVEQELKKQKFIAEQCEARYERIKAQLREKNANDSYRRTSSLVSDRRREERPKDKRPRDEGSMSARTRHEGSLAKRYRQDSPKYSRHRYETSMESPMDSRSRNESPMDPRFRKESHMEPRSRNESPMNPRLRDERSIGEMARKPSIAMQPREEKRIPAEEVFELPSFVDCIDPEILEEAARMSGDANLFAKPKQPKTKELSESPLPEKKSTLPHVSAKNVRESSVNSRSNVTQHSSKMLNMSQPSSSSRSHAIHPSTSTTGQLHQPQPQQAKALVASTRAQVPQLQQSMIPKSRDPEHIQQAGVMNTRAHTSQSHSASKKQGQQPSIAPRTTTQQHAIQPQAHHQAIVAATPTPNARDRAPQAQPIVKTQMQQQAPMKSFRAQVPQTSMSNGPGHIQYSSMVNDRASTPQLEPAEEIEVEQMHPIMAAIKAAQKCYPPTNDRPRTSQSQPANRIQVQQQTVMSSTMAARSQAPQSQADIVSTSSSRVQFTQEEMIPKLIEQIRTIQREEAEKAAQVQAQATVIARANNRIRTQPNPIIVDSEPQESIPAMLIGNPYIPQSAMRPMRAMRDEKMFNQAHGLQYRAVVPMMTAPPSIPQQIAPMMNDRASHVNQTTMVPMSLPYVQQPAARPIDRPVIAPMDLRHIPPNPIQILDNEASSIQVPVRFIYPPVESTFHDTVRHEDQYDDRRREHRREEDRRYDERGREERRREEHRYEERRDDRSRHSVPSPWVNPSSLVPHRDSYSSSSRQYPLRMDDGFGASPWSHQPSPWQNNRNAIQPSPSLPQRSDGRPGSQMNYEGYMNMKRNDQF